ncbi:hypothetical protein AB0D13_15155 [Streptomyces sp. NPDC048430]|uniref:hypothetical protein n=1 Tax=Streptomyces sp. NPDC048430 TaxID=3155388 RepID=UPI00343DC169
MRLIEELAQPWQACVEGRRHAARGGERKRATGAGARHQLVFVGRLVATLIHLRHDLPHAVLGLLFGVDRQGRTPWTDALRPGRIHDATAARSEGPPRPPAATYRAIAGLVSDRTARI